MKIRCFYTKSGFTKYISHLDMIKLLQRAVFYTNAKVKFSQGFNPHPVMSFGNPLSLGISSDKEVFEITLAEYYSVSKFQEEMNRYLPKNIQITECFEINDQKSINNLFSKVRYEIGIFSEDEILIENFDDGKPLIVEKTKKDKKNRLYKMEKDVRNNILEMNNLKKKDDLYFFEMVLDVNEGNTINPNLIMEAIIKKFALKINIDDVNIHKKDMFN